MKNKGKLALLLIGVTIGTMHVINRIQYSRLNLKGPAVCPKNNYFEWRFGKIKYTKKGIGKPILLIHDLSIGSSSYEYNKIADQLALNHEVYTIDLLGYGMSDKPNMTYTNFLYVQLITDFIKTVIGKKVDIVTSGESAPIAIMSCHNDPDLFNNILFISPQNLTTLNLIPSKRTKALKLILDSPIIGTFIFNIISSNIFMRYTFRKKYFFDPLKIDEDDILSFEVASHLIDHNSKYSFTSHITKYMNTNIVHALKEINHNIIIVAGKEIDHIGDITTMYTEYNNAIEISYIKETKHLPHMENPKEFLSHIKPYLD